MRAHIRHKAVGSVQAIGIRRSMLLQRGCEQWLTSACQTRQWRSEVAMRRQAEQHARLYARVARCVFEY